MKKLIAFILALLLIVAGCGITKPTLPQATDNTAVHLVDSIAWHDSTLYHHVYKEVYNDYADLLDTLKLSTTYSEFESYIDTTAKKLKGTAKNKDVDIPVQIKWKEKIVYRDSVRIVREPYPVEVEKIVYRHTFWDKLCWLLSGILLLIAVWKVVKIYLKI